jgi:hypothetical protein
VSFQYDVWRVAQAEIMEAFAYYEKLQPVLGSDFLKAVDECIDLIKDNPYAYQIVLQNVRRIMVHPFPYGLLYTIDNDVVLVAGCVHAHRDPSLWQNRFW